MRILVTGGAGFIGSHLVDGFRARGDEVAVLDNLSTGRRENVQAGVALYEADVRDGDAVARALGDFKPARVLHQAAQASVKRSTDEPRLDADVNLIGGINVLLAARATGVERVLFASTGGAIYGEVAEGKRADESWPPRPKSPYAASKASFEHYLAVFEQCYGLAYAILRYANVYGPRQDPHGEAGVVAIFARRLLAREPVTLFARRRPGDDGGVRDYVHVRDVVQANLLLADGRGGERVYNVATGIGRSTRDVLRAVSAAVGVEPTVEEAPPRAGDLEVSVLDPSRLASLGWRASTGFADGIADTVAWFAPRSVTSNTTGRLP